LTLDLLKAWAPQAYGIWTLVLIAALYFVREWRETRKMSSADRLARREGYAHQVQVLLKENRDLGSDMRELREEYDDYRRLCREETDQLRTQIRLLEDELQGLKRRLDAQGSAAGRMISDMRSEPPRRI
jgi:predicted  nucleic acid-binding Zn-ribbon protein